MNLQVVLLGEGAGANILLRFALCHSKRVYGLIAVNCVAGPNVGAIFDAIKVTLYHIFAIEKLPYL